MDQPSTPSCKTSILGTSHPRGYFEIGGPHRVKVRSGEEEILKKSPWYVYKTDQTPRSLKPKAIRLESTLRE